MSVTLSGKRHRLATTSCGALALAMIMTGTAHAQRATNSDTAQPVQSAPAAGPQGGSLPAETQAQPQTGPVDADKVVGPDASSADAQALPPGSPAPAPGDVVVVGTRASLQSAIARKRNAGTVVDSIVADDIASFPDKNVGDSLARVTGVQLSRDFGEGTQVSIRGVEPDLNRVEINGVSQVSTQGTRAGDFRELATELVKSIDVYKGYSVDLAEGGIGGTVSIETRRPLDLKKSLASVVFSEQHLDTTQDWKPRITAVAGTPHLFIDGLGALVNVTYDNVTTRQDYVSNTNWSRLADFDHSDQKTVADPLYANYNTYASCANVGGASTANATARRLACETQFFDWAPTVPRYRSWVRKDKRISGDAQLQYEVAPNFRAYVEATINHRDQNYQDANYTLDMGRYQRYQLDPTLPAGLNGGTSRPQVLASSATVDANHVVTSYTTALTSSNIGSTASPTYTGAANILQVQRRNYDDEQSSYYYQTGFDWNVGDLHLKALASHATARDVGNNTLIQISTGIAGVTVDRRNDLGIPVFIFPSSVDPADYTTYTVANRAGTTLANGTITQAGPTLQYRPNDYNNHENQLKLDADYDTHWSIIPSIEYGGQFRSQQYLNYTGGGTNLLNAATGLYQTSSYVSDNTTIVPTVTARSTLTTNSGSSGQVYTYQLTQAEYVSILNASHAVVPTGAPLFGGLRNAPANIPNNFAVPVFDSSVLSQYYDLSGFDQDRERYSDGLPQIPNVKIDETIASAYFKVNLDTRVLGMHLSGNGGVRYTHTRDEGTGTNILRVTTQAASGAATTAVAVSEQLSLTHDYTDWLPAFNLALDITPNLTLRGNWAKNLARPKPTDLVPNITCTNDETAASDLQDACTAGNPDLVPYRADQWEANLAWYPNRDTLISIGYYKKAEKSFVISAVTRADVDLFHDGILYTVKQPINGFGALLDGFEASAQTVFTFLPKPLDGFGASANFTFARALRTNLTNVATNQPLNDYPGLSKYTWNASVFYDKGPINVRVNYNYRSDWLVTVTDANNGNNPIYRKAEGYFDGKITFRMPEFHSSVFLEMQNINKEYSQTFIKGIGPVDLYYPGQRFFTGIQLKF